MLNKQDFAQSESKSLAKRSAQHASSAQRTTKLGAPSSNLDQATKLLQETIIKIDGAYAPSTIRTYRADFNDFIYFCRDKNANALPSRPIYM